LRLHLPRSHSATGGLDTIILYRRVESFLKASRPTCGYFSDFGLCSCPVSQSPQNGQLTFESAPFRSLFLGSESALHVNLSGDLASASSSSAAAGHLSRCLSALFDLDSPVLPVPCGNLVVWGGLLALPPPCGLSVASALRARATTYRQQLARPKLPDDTREGLLIAGRLI
jgi:hypothetical protein